jgi:hypothetical protein
MNLDTLFEWHRQTLKPNWMASRKRSDNGGIVSTNQYQKTRTPCHSMHTGGTLRKQALCASISSLQFSSPFSTMQMSRGLLVTGQLQQMRGFSAGLLASDDAAAAPASA